MERITSSIAAMHASAGPLGNGFRQASSRARFQASGSAPSAALAMVLAFFDRAVLDQRAERPALQREIGGTGGMQRKLAVNAAGTSALLSSLSARAM